MPRFVLLRHEMPPESDRPPHLDFMIQRGDTLRVWALPHEPQPGEPLPAKPLPDHRLAYLDYEGPVSENRGHVKQVDAGTYSVVEEDAASLLLDLSGGHLRGTIRLTEQGEGWLLEFAPGA